MKKQTVIFLLALTAMVSVAVSQVVITRRAFDDRGLPIGVGYGTALPTVANDGRGPVDGEFFAIKSAGTTDPMTKVYMETVGDWVDINTAKYNVIREDFTFVAGQNFEEDLTAAVVTDGGENVFILPGSTLGVFSYRLEAPDGPGLAATLTPFSALGELQLQSFADDAANEGVELVFGAWGPDLQGAHFDEDAGNIMYCEADITIADVSDTDDLWFGWVVKEAYDNPPASASFNTAALFVLSDAAGDLDIETELNAGGTLNDDTGVTWADAANHKLRVIAEADSVSFILDESPVTQTNAVLDMDATDQAVCVFGYVLAAASDPGITIDYVEIGVGQAGITAQ